MYTMMLAAS